MRAKSEMSGGGDGSGVDGGRGSDTRESWMVWMIVRVEDGREGEGRGGEVTRESREWCG